MGENIFYMLAFIYYREDQITFLQSEKEMFDNFEKYKSKL